MNDKWLMSTNSPFLEFYTYKGDRILNYFIRSKLKLSYLAFETIQEIIKLLNSAEPSPTEIILYRGLKNFELDPNNKLIELLGFNSMTYDYTVAYRFATPAYDNSLILNIRFPVGTQFLAFNPAESEILTYPNGIYQITKYEIIQGHDNDIIHSYNLNYLRNDYQNMPKIEDNYQKNFDYLFIKYILYLYKYIILDLKSEAYQDFIIYMLHWTYIYYNCLINYDDFMIIQQTILKDFNFNKILNLESKFVEYTNLNKISNFYTQFFMNLIHIIDPNFLNYYDYVNQKNNLTLGDNFLPINYYHLTSDDLSFEKHAFSDKNLVSIYMFLPIF